MVNCELALCSCVLVLLQVDIPTCVRDSIRHSYSYEYRKVLSFCPNEQIHVGTWEKSIVIVRKQIHENK